MTNVKEAMAWLSYTYLYVRMLKNPLPYGVSWQELTADPRLDGRRHSALSCCFHMHCFVHAFLIRFVPHLLLPYFVAAKANWNPNTIVHCPCRPF